MNIEQFRKEKDGVHEDHPYERGAAERSFTFPPEDREGAPIRVDVHMRECVPERCTYPDEPVLLLAGSEMSANHPHIEDMAEAYARLLEAPVHVLSTTTPERNGHVATDVQFLHEEMRALVLYVHDLVKNEGAHEITIIGHSQGAIKAMGLDVLLQRFQIVPVRALVLLDPAGLHTIPQEQQMRGVQIEAQRAAEHATAAFSADMFVNPFRAMTRGFGASMYGMQSVAAMAQRGDITAHYMKEMEPVSAYVRDVHTPTIVVDATHDELTGIAHALHARGDTRDAGEYVRSVFPSDTPVSFVPVEGDHTTVLWDMQVADSVVAQFPARRSAAHQ